MRPERLHQHREAEPRSLAKKSVLVSCFTLALLCMFVFVSLLTASSASAKEVQQLPHEPTNPKRHQVYFNTTTKTEHIYNGQEWVPHDKSIDTYVLKKYQKPNVKKSTSGDGAGTSDNQGVSK